MSSCESWDDYQIEMSMIERNIVRGASVDPEKAVSDALFFLDEFVAPEEHCAAVLGLASRFPPWVGVALVGEFYESRKEDEDLTIEEIAQMSADLRCPSINIGLRFCEDVLAGKYRATTDDAISFAQAYAIEFNGAAGNHRRKVLTSKVQPSKLLRFGYMAEDFGSAAPGMILEVLDVYETQIRPVPAHMAMVQERGSIPSVVRVLRRIIDAQKMLSKQRIFDIMTQPQPRLLPHRR